MVGALLTQGLQICAACDDLLPNYHEASNKYVRTMKENFGTLLNQGKGIFPYCKNKAYFLNISA